MVKFRWSRQLGEECRPDLMQTPTVSGWAWAGASVTGESHLRNGETGQDSGSFHTYTSKTDDVAVAVVCDGAGSAPHSKLGSQLVAIKAQRIVAAFLASGGDLARLGRAGAAGFIAELHSALARKAAEHGCKVRDLATTMTLAIVAEEIAVVIQVGDSACAVRCNGEWQIPIWPMNGEYVNLTYFVSGFPRVPLAFATMRGKVTHLAVFSDGLGDMVLDRSSRSPFVPFFEGVFDGAGLGQSSGRDRGASVDLGHFLCSAKASERSDDDKTLIIAARVKS